MEGVPTNESMERLITTEERERLESALASYGLVDVTLGDMPTKAPHNDLEWAVDTLPDNIVLGLE